MLQHSLSLKCLGLSGLEVNISKGLSINDATFGRKGGEPKVTKSEGGRGVLFCP